MNNNSDEWGNPHYGVTLETIAADLPRGKCRIVGYFYPKGLLRHREKVYAYELDNRKTYDAVSGRIFRLFGNTTRASNKFFEEMKPKEN